MAAPFAVEHIPVDDVFVVGKRRDASGAAVATLAESIKRIGLQMPITVRVDETIPDPETGEVMGAYALIAGRHRLEAYRSLGIDRIPAVVRDCDEIDAQLWEIAENLHRAELTALERDEQVALWVKLSAEKLTRPVSLSGGRGNKGNRSVAEEIGVNREDARRAVKVASLSDEAKAVAKEVGLDDNRTALLQAASRGTVAEQVEALRQRVAAKPARLADVPLNDFEAQELQVAALMAAWNKASKEAREEFMARIDTPVFERGAA